MSYKEKKLPGMVAHAWHPSTEVKARESIQPGQYETLSQRIKIDQQINEVYFGSRFWGLGSLTAQPQLLVSTSVVGKCHAQMRTDNPSSSGNQPAPMRQVLIPLYDLIAFKGPPGLNATTVAPAFKMSFCENKLYLHHKRLPRSHDTGGRRGFQQQDGTQAEQQPKS